MPELKYRDVRLDGWLSENALALTVGVAKLLEAVLWVAIRTCGLGKLALAVLGGTEQVPVGVVWRAARGSQQRSLGVRWSALDVHVRSCCRC